MSDTEEARWVYGVVSSDASLTELERRSGSLPAVWLVEAGDLAAIVGDVPRGGARATRNQALAHARVLEAAVADAPVVPFRFGVMVPGGDSEVGRELLQSRHDELAQLLRRLEGRVQMTVKAYYHEEPLLREIIAGDAEIGALREATHGREDDEVTRNYRVRLGELVNAAVEQRRQRDAAEIIERLKPVSIAAVIDPIEREFMVLNAPFLVDRDRLPEFERAVEGLARDRADSIRFRLLGPMPCYNFLDVEQPAWA